MITVKIDVTKIDKKYLFEGVKGTYLDIVLFESKSQYADYTAVQGLSKELREQGVKGEILGDAKDWNKVQPAEDKPKPTQPEPEPKANEPEDYNPDLDDDSSGLPF